MYYLPPPPPILHTYIFSTVSDSGTDPTVVWREQWQWRSWVAPGWRPPQPPPPTLRRAGLKTNAYGTFNLWKDLEKPATLNLEHFKYQRLCISIREGPHSLLLDQAMDLCYYSVSRISDLDLDPHGSVTFGLPRCNTIRHRLGYFLFLSTITDTLSN